MYDPQLRLIHQFNEKITGFTASSATLQYSSDLRLEFVVNDQKNQKQKFIFLDKDLKAYYKSESSPKPIVLTTAQVKTLDKFRIDDFAWEIRTETQEIGWSGTATRITLYQYGIKLQPMWPSYELNRAIVLDSSAVEYGKVFLVRDNKIYVYVNESTVNGKQFVYCISGLDGKLIYKTELSVSFSNPLSEHDEFGISKFEYSDACIFSNYFWDPKLNRLIIGGTWLAKSTLKLADSTFNSGIFLVQLDENGTVTGSTADYAYWYESRTYGGQHSGTGGFSRNKETYYRIKSMGYQGDGTFSILTEAYGKLRLFQPAGKEPEKIYLQDELYHYFSVEAYYFQMKLGLIEPKCAECIVRIVPWVANHHLDSITGFISGKSRMSDKKWASDVNVLCDGMLSDGCYSAGFRGPEKNAAKVLTCEPVNYDGTNDNEIYFSKSIFSANNSNRVALLEPNPIHEQNFAEQNDFYAIDAQRLYRVSVKAEGYSLRITNW